MATLRIFYGSPQVSVFQERRTEAEALLDYDETFDQCVGFFLADFKKCSKRF